MQSLTLEQIENLALCAAGRAAEQTIQRNTDAMTREIESCMAWHAIAARMRRKFDTTYETMVQVLASLRRIDPNGEWYAEDFPFDDPEACQYAIETLESLRA